MTSLVSVAGHEIGKIGIGMSQQPKTKNKQQQQHSVKQIKPPKRAQQQPRPPKTKCSFDLLSPDILPTQQRRQKSSAASMKMDLRTSGSIPCTSSASFDSTRTGTGRAGSSYADEDQSSSPAFASDTDHSSTSPNPLKCKDQTSTKKVCLLPTEMTDNLPAS